ncbi:MAG: hypothetical protein BGO31_09445 [Bacteroidetes bacterium 43-16]|nr:MAG: hypothetical protein BGO31_09445 [Bacteroidetes bacterium 43-16]
MQAALQHKKAIPNWLNLVAILILLASIAVFSATQFYIAITLPFALLFVAWLVLNWKSYYWFFIFAIATTGIVKVGTGTMYLPLMPLSIISALLALALLLYNRKLVYDNFYRHPLTLIIFLQFFWLMISVIFSEIPLPSIKYLGVNTIQLLSFLILPMMVLKKEADWMKLCKILMISFTLVATYVLIRHALKNFTYLYTNVAVKPFFYNHVDHGCILSMLVPIPYMLWKHTDKSKVWTRRFYLLLLVFFIVCTYLTFARAAILAVAFAFVIIYAIRKKLVNWLMTLFFICAFSIVAYLVVDDNYKNFKPNYEQTYSRHSFDDLLKATFMGGDMSSMERFYRWIASARMSMEKPMTGVGPNNFYDFYKPHAIQMFRTYVSRNEEKSTTHNYFIFMLVEQGWPAMILYGIFIWALFYQAQKLYHKTRNVLYRRMTLVAAMVIAAFFINNLFSELLQTYKIGAIFYLATVLLYWVGNQIKKENKQEQLS